MLSKVFREAFDVDTWSVDVNTRIIDRQNDIRKVTLFPCTDRSRTKLFNPDIFALDKLRKTFLEQGITITDISKKNTQLVFILVRGVFKREASLTLSKKKSSGCFAFTEIPRG